MLSLLEGEVTGSVPPTVPQSFPAELKDFFTRYNLHVSRKHTRPPRSMTSLHLQNITLHFDASLWRHSIWRHSIRRHSIRRHSIWRHSIQRHSNSTSVHVMNIEKWTHVICPLAYTTYSWLMCVCTSFSVASHCLRHSTSIPLLSPYKVPLSWRWGPVLRTPTAQPHLHRTRTSPQLYLKQRHRGRRRGRQRNGWTITCARKCRLFRSLVVGNSIFLCKCFQRKVKNK